MCYMSFHCRSTTSDQSTTATVVAVAAVVIPSGRTAHIPHTFAVFLWVMEAVMLNHCANVVVYIRVWVE